MKCAAKVFFKKIDLLGLENIPKDKPIIFASNHNSAFMDAVVIAVFIQPQIYFLTRSDVFNTPLKRWILKKMKLLPIYRLQEGAENLHKNEQVFKDCYQLLSENKSILIFSEGICIQEKRLQKLKKGTARIAFGAEVYNKFNLDLQIVPVGINYNKPSQFRSNLLLKFGETLSVKSYTELYKTDENKATYQFTRDLEEKMAQQIVNLKNKKSDVFYEQLTEFYTKDVHEKLKLNKSDALEVYFVMRQLGEVVNEWEVEQTTQFHSVKEKLNSYFESLSKAGLRDKVIRKSKSSSNTAALLPKVLLAFILFPLHALSLCLNYISYKLPYLIAKKTCKHIEFVSSVIIGAGAFLYLISFLICGFVFSSFVSGYLAKTITFLIAPLLAWFSLHYYSFFKNLRLEIKFQKSEEELKTNLLQERAELLQVFDESILPKLKIRNS